MSKVCGIITEYNPFHNGHAYHLDRSRREVGAQDVIAVMSGDFVQRGEPAMLDKYRRAQMAINCGVDIVLELPVAWATSSAEGFADGACRVLAATNIVDTLCFGSEIGEISPLWDIARQLCRETDEFKQVLKTNLAEGVSFPMARATAIATTMGDDAADIINHPNNILGIEYLKAIINNDLVSRIAVRTIKRQGAAHNSDQLQTEHASYGTASAGAIRKHIHAGGDLARLLPLMPQNSFRVLVGEHRKTSINRLDNFSSYLHYALHSTSKEQLLKLSGLSQSMLNRLVNTAKSHYLISDVLEATKSKSHTHTALQRAVLRIILGIYADSAKADIPYIRVLGFRRKKEALLKRLHATSALPVVTNLKHAKNLSSNAHIMLEAEMSATRAYWLGLKAQGVPEKNELERPMAMV
ncbi:MAG: nucleotidyltransferase family protein [Defluviitaleaceae bacterium]|nr:nucleotidyltransferase family protein [Defluviitaleaceae bacterium]